MNRIESPSACTFESSRQTNRSIEPRPSHRFDFKRLVAFVYYSRYIYPFRLHGEFTDGIYVPVRLLLWHEIFQHKIFATRSVVIVGTTVH